MADILYKRLFEVQLLHEYYLTNSDGSNVFDKNVNASNFLMERYGKDIASITDSLSCKVPASLQNLFKNYHLHMLTNYSGFSILCRVTGQTLPSGQIVYKPFVKLPDHFNILVQLSLKNNLLDAVTNTRINNAIPAVYYFTNEDIITPKKFPALSADIPLFDPAYLYEQGELYTGDQNKIFRFDLDDEPVEGFGYANTRDRLIVPVKFTYKFDTADKVTHALFELRNSQGKIVRSYEFKNELPLQKLAINFINDQSPGLDIPKDKIVTLPSSGVTSENIYTLDVTINDTKTLIHTLIFFEDDDLSNPFWGIVNIKPAVSNAAFSLYNADGTIKYSKMPGGTATAIPVFEVRVRSRIVYWRYINDMLGKLKADSSNTFLEKEDNNLVTKKPRVSSYLPTLFKESDNTVYFPNPASDENIKIEGRRIYSDILVPESKMFPLDTS